jgi:hypothetical protein
MTVTRRAETTTNGYAGANDALKLLYCLQAAGLPGFVEGCRSPLRDLVSLVIAKLNSEPQPPNGRTEWRERPAVTK